jgi:hypothetical protein
VKFGISPFGIWRPGYPAAVRGLDAYDVLFADSRRWLMEGWLDYFTPQLYWAVAAPQQSYPTLLEWWAAQNRRGRHLWVGNGTYKVTDVGSARWPASEMLQQIRLTRDRAGAGGNVHFSMTSLVRSVDELSDRLVEGPYAGPALVPASPWLSATRPATPVVAVTRNSRSITLRISTPSPGAPADRTAAASARPRWWLIRSRYADGWHGRVVDAGTASVTVQHGVTGGLPDFLVVSSVDRAGVESSPVRVVEGLVPAAGLRP